MKFVMAIIWAGALTLLAAGAASAQSQSGSVSQSGSQAAAGVNISNHSTDNTPSAIGPGLTASGLSCSGSASIGGSGAGWGLSLGITREDRHCNAREDAKYIGAITGNIGAAKARLCMVEDNQEAFRLAGDPCPQDRARVTRTSATTTGSVSGGSRQLSRRALGLSSADMRAKGCDVQRRNGRNTWVCPPGTTF